MANELQPNRVIANSFYKEDGESNDNFTLLLPSVIRNAKSIAFQTSVIPNAMLPFKGVGFTRPNNELLITHDAAGAGVQAPVSIPTDRSYLSGTEVADALEVALNTVFGVNTYEVVYDINRNVLDPNYVNIEPNLQLTIRNTVTAFTIDGGNGLVKMGFEADYSVPALLQNATQPLNLNRTAIIQLHSNLADGDTLTDQQQDRFDIAVIIPVTTSYGFIQTFQASNDRVLKEQQKGIGRISFTLRDEDGDLLGLPDWAYTHFELQIEYEDPAKDPNRTLP